MSTVLLGVGDIHYVAEDAIGGSAPCGVKILTRDNITTNYEHVSCLDCAIRMVAFFQNAQSAMLKTIAGRVAMLQKQLAANQELAKR